MEAKHPLMKKSFPKDERLSLPLHRGIVDFMGRRPLVPVLVTTFASANSPLEAIGIGTGLVAAWTAATIALWKKTGITPDSLRGQWHDRAANRLLAKRDKNAMHIYSENSPKVMAHMLHASAHRASHAGFNGFRNILGQG